VPPPAVQHGVNAARYPRRVTDDRARPEWAQRLQRERLARGWSQSDAVAAMRTFSDVPLPDGLVDQWKRWERGRNKPDEFYRPLIAATLGTVIESIFGEKRVPYRAQTTDDLLISRSGMDTLELVQRIRRSSVNDSTLDALELTVQQLCCDYVRRDPHELIEESRQWLAQLTRLLDERLTLTQHKDVLDNAGWLTLLVGCLEYDTGQHRAAEATRVAALQLGKEAGNQNVVGWAHEMRAWFASPDGATARSSRPPRPAKMQLPDVQWPCNCRPRRRRRGHAWATSATSPVRWRRVVCSSIPCHTRSGRTITSS
jgi:hypothetical protein